LKLPEARHFAAMSRRNARGQHWEEDERGQAAAARSSLSAPRMTILSASSGNGLCSSFASSHGARIQTSRSSSVVKITGIAFG
jgi:hypothetical protein